ncbi:MAG: alpha/beta hydrolase [Chitinophagia bacterium]|nr:alpha/beta hydrolase [Chitinophagia bacterium]
MKPIHFILLLLMGVLQNISLVAQIPIPSNGKIIRHENFFSAYVTSRNIDVWLPDNYSPSSKYAVLYMQDGQMLFDSTVTWNKQEWGVDETISQLLHQNKIQNCIVVGIWNGGLNRHTEYFPQKPFESLSQAQQEAVYKASRSSGQSIFGGKYIISDKYLHFLTRELKPFIDSAYSTRVDREHTFIAGSSMGALISMYALCEYPQIFGGAACLSTHWPGIFTSENNPIPDAFIAYMNKNLPSPLQHRIYFDYGSETLDAMYAPFQAKADSILIKKGYTEKHWMTKYWPGQDHSERSWKSRLSVPLLFLLGK